MNELKIFENAEFGKVRTVVINDEPMFCLADVCRVLEIKNSRDCKNRLNEKGVVTTDTLTNGGKQEMTFINESNLYKVIFQSRKKEAEQFADWVTSEVLPSIRKHGVYAIDELLNNPDMLIKSLEALKEERAKNAELEETVGVQKQQIAELQPKASYYDLILNCKEAIAISIIAKDYGMSAQRMNSILHDKGVQYKQGEIWLLKQKYADKGYTVTKTKPIMKTDGRMGAKVHTYWTQKGRIFIYNLLKESDILPLIEIGMEEEEIC